MDKDKPQNGASPAQIALVSGHLAAGRPGMAALALTLPTNVLERLDAELEAAKALAAAEILLAWGKD